MPAGALDLPGTPRRGTHQQHRREGPAPFGGSTQDQTWRPIRQKCDLPQPVAHGDGHPQASGPGPLELVGTGLDCPSPRRCDALAGAGSLRRRSKTAIQITQLS